MTCNGLPTNGTCDFGFTDLDGWCDRSFNFQGACSGYDTDTCFCSDQNYPMEPEVCDGGWAWSWIELACVSSSPILIDVSGDGFALTDLINGINFDLTGSGTQRRLSWVAAGSDDSWLVLDRNSNGVIDNGLELFGDATIQPALASGEDRNGFRALAMFDARDSGGNEDGKISIADSVFSTLLLWQDLNHNGISEPTELHTLSDLGLVSIDLKYKKSKNTDQYGNEFRYRSKVRDVKGSTLNHWAWDVFLKTN